MRFLADESCDYGVVRVLRQVGHDVLAVRDVMPGAHDPAVMELAQHEARILLTEDKDFGQLVYAGSARSYGVILFRVPLNARGWLLEELAGLIERHSQRLQGKFVVIQPGRIRVSEYPHEG